MISWSLQVHQNVCIKSSYFCWSVHWLLVASEEPKSGAVKSDEVECFLSTRNRKHSHSLNTVTCNAVEKYADDTYPFTVQKRWEKNDPKPLPRKTLLQSFSFLQSSINFISQVPFMAADLICVSRCSSTVNSKPAVWCWSGSRHPWLKRQPRVEGRPSTAARWEEKEVKASHPSTPLALNARVQLCSEFFLRTSCGSRNNDSRSLPPLSPLKYGICIIQIEEPLFGVFFFT